MMLPPHTMYGEQHRAFRVFGVFGTGPGSLINEQAQSGARV